MQNRLRLSKNKSKLKQKEPTLRLKEPITKAEESQYIRNFCFRQLRFYENHQYQFLLVYLLRFLRVLDNRQQRQEPRRNTHGKLTALLQSKRRREQLEQQVKSWAYRLSLKPAFKAFFWGTILQVNPMTLFMVLSFDIPKQKKIPGLPWHRDRKNAWIPDKFNTKAFFEYLKVIRPPLTEKYVSTGMAYIQQKILTDPDPRWTRTWTECMRLITSYCGKRPGTVGIEEQIALLENYRIYLKYVRQQGPRKALGILSRERGWPHRGKGEKQIFLLNNFFNEVEKVFKKLEFTRKEFVTYVLRNLKQKADKISLAQTEPDPAAPEEKDIHMPSFQELLTRKPESDREQDLLKFIGCTTELFSESSAPESRKDGLNEPP